jgi:hypothetical protein
MSVWSMISGTVTSVVVEVNANILEGGGIMIL